MTRNEYIPFSSRVLSVTRHTDIEYTFTMEYGGDVKPGQFFEISLPKFGEAPISVSGIGKDTIDFTIRRVGKVTDEIFEAYEGSSLFLRGPYGNGFDFANYDGKELVVIAGGTGLSPVRGVVEHYTQNPDKIKGLTLVAGFKTPADILFLADFGRWKQTADVILTVDCADEDVSCNIGLVTEFIPQLKVENKSSAAAIVVGPPMMMRFSTQGLLDAGFFEENIWVSFERKMCCGIGKCGHCKTDDSYVCLDGPVFPFAKGRTLVD